MNYMRFFSKGSIGSSSSAKSLSPSDEVKKFKYEIDSLKQTIEALKLTVETRDAAVGTLAREKEKFYVELKAAQRTNRNLHQQLNDERDMHFKEKDFLIEEIKRLSKKKEMYSSEDENNFEHYHGSLNHCSSEEELRKKDEIICNVCMKYLKIKSSKKILLDKIRKLETRSQKACEDVIIILQENKKYVDALLSKIIENRNIPSNSKDYFKMLRGNAKLHYENIQLKIHLTVPISIPITTVKKGCLNERNYDQDQYTKSLESYLEMNRVPKASVSQHTARRRQHHKELTNVHSSNSYFTRGTIYKSYSDSRLSKFWKQ